MVSYLHFPLGTLQPYPLGWPLGGGRIGSVPAPFASSNLLTPAQILGYWGNFFGGAEDAGEKLALFYWENEVYFVNVAFASVNLDFLASDGVLFVKHF